MNLFDFDRWLNENANDLVERLRGWLPNSLEITESDVALEQEVMRTAEIIRDAINIEDGSDADEAPIAQASQRDESEEPIARLELPLETGLASQNLDAGVNNRLLDRLLDTGVLPRYAFPTDVASFYVFDNAESTRFRPVFRYAPSQDLSIALSGYAPGKTVWIKDGEWTSGAIYSPYPEERSRVWSDRRIYFECSVCGYAEVSGLDDADRGQERDCSACRSIGTFGPGRSWIRPPGFAHPSFIAENTSPDDEPEASYATRAKLTVPGAGDDSAWLRVAPGLRTHFMRAQLLVTNSAPRSQGYTYCTRCGRIEPAVRRHSQLLSPHQKPFPDSREPQCEAGATARHIVLGTRFPSGCIAHLAASRRSCDSASRV